MIEYRDDVRKLAMWIHVLSQIHNIKYHITSFALEDKTVCHHFHVHDSRNNITILTCSASSEGFVSVSYYNNSILCEDIFSDLMLENPAELVNIDRHGELRIPSCLEKCVDILNQILS